MKLQLSDRQKSFVRILLESILPFAVLLLGFVLTGVGWHYTTNVVERDREINFQLQVDRSKYAIELRVQSYITILRAAEGLFAASENVSRSEWKAFVETLELETFYRGIKGIGFIRYVPDSQKADYEKKVRFDTSVEPNGYPDFAIKPTGDRPAYFVVEYIEPFLPNKPSFGFDISSEAIRWKAVQRAQDTGQASASEPIVLVQDPTKQPGILILMPVYRNGMPHSSVVERRKALLGFVYTPLRVADLIEEALPKVGKPSLDLAIYDGKKLIYESTQVRQIAHRNLQSLLQQGTTLEVAGENWRLYFSSTPMNKAFWMPTPILVLSSGTLISLSLFGIISLLTSSRRRAFQIANLITTELSKANAQLQIEIKERKQVEEELKETTRLQNAILASANYTIISTKIDGTILTFNRSAEQWLGYDASEVIGKAKPEIFHDLDEVVLRAQELSLEMGVPIEPGFEVFVAKARQGKSDEREWTYISKNGDRFPVMLSITALYDTKNNNITGFVGIGSNITEQKRSQAALQQSQLLLDGILSNSLDGITAFSSVRNSQGKIVDFQWLLVNSSGAKIVKRQAEDLIGKYMLEEMPGNQPEGLFAAYVRVVETGEPLERELYYRHEQVEGWFFISAVKLGDGFAVTFRDIGERKQTEIALRQSEKRYRLIVEDRTELIVRFDCKGMLTFVNEAYCRYFGKEQKDLINNSFEPLVFPEDKEKLRQHLDSLNLENSLGTIEHRVIINNQVRWLQWINRKIFDRKGNLVEFQSVGQDINDRKQAEEQLQTSLQEKEILLKEVHHRVKNNLQVIDSLFRHQSRYIKDKQLAQILKECQNRVSLMALLHENLYQSQDFANINVAEYLKTLVNNLYDSYKNNRILPILKLDIKSIFIPLPIALPCGLIINELVSNCLKYAFPEGKNGYLQIQFLDDDLGNFSIIVRDNGIGLPKDFNLGTTNSLGLKLVKSFVRQLQGTIQIKSDRGTEFTICFRG